MPEETTPWPGAQRQMTGASLQQVRFTPARGPGQAYDAAEVDTFVARCMHELETLNGRIHALEDENRRFQDASKDRSEDEVLRSVSILIQAQRTADMTIAQADDYSARVMAEARSMYENARHTAGKMVDEAHGQAKAAADQKGEMEREATYLRTLRDVTRTQIETFLEGLLDQLTAEYGRATASAAEAAANSDSSRGRSTARTVESHNARPR